MYSAIILGDIHLGKGINIGKAGVGSNLNSRIVDQLNLLEWTLDQAHDRSCDDIILTGDVFEDPKPHPYLITLFIAWLKKCQAYNVNVHIIMGNHDILRSGSVYSSPLDIISEAGIENVDVYRDINTVYIGTTAFTFVPFRDRKSYNVTSNAEALALLTDSLVYELSSIPLTYKKVIVGHLAIEGSIPIGDEFDDINNELFCPITMFAGYDYVWMGHVHKPQVMNKVPHIAHVGSMDISNFGETDHKKHIVIVDCNSNDFSIEYLPTRALKKILVTVPKDTVDSTQYVLDELKKAQNLDKSIVKVEVSLAVPELKSINKSSIEKYLSEQGVYNVTGISENKKFALIKKDTNSTSIDTKMDVSSAIKTYAQTYIEDKARSEFIDVAMSIFNAYKAEAKE